MAEEIYVCVCGFKQVKSTLIKSGWKCPRRDCGAAMQKSPV